jgi:hypothetical protein
MAIPRNTMLAIANLFSLPIPAVRVTCAKHRYATIATVKKGFL